MNIWLSEACLAKKFVRPTKFSIGGPLSESNINRAYMILTLTLKLS